MPNVELRFACPEDMRHHVARVLEGEYELPLKDVSSVLDIGANIGAFTLWAMTRWPGCRVEAYEPHPLAYEALMKNRVANVGLGGALTPHMAAVVCSPQDLPAVRLYEGPRNLGEASTSRLWHSDESRSRLVPSVLAADLPACDVVKIDCEGAEVPILRDYLGRHSPVGVAYEYHRKADRDALEALLAAKGYGLVGGSYATTTTGVQRWVKG